MKKFFTNIQRKLLHLRLQPIRVFCFHHVSDEYDPLTMWKCDWTQTDVLKNNIVHLIKQGYRFISLQEAQSHLQNDRFRFSKYAVLTSDDGYKSLNNILPWLLERQIPIALFINAHYMEGNAWGPQQDELISQTNLNMNMNELAKDIYLSEREIFSLTSPFISIGSHGYDHTDASCQNKEDFLFNVSTCVEKLRSHPRYIPFHAFTWGHYNKMNLQVLREMKISPVFCGGEDNYNNPNHIDRIAIDGKQF